ncbi:MAG: cytochrome P450 [Acidocella sp.]|nr:cytochrome P450 [Acidocella sp.]
MSEAMALAAKPDHVPADRVIDFNIYGVPEQGKDYQERWVEIRDRAPDVFWTPRNGGHWVATRAPDIETVQLKHEIFSHEIISLPRETNIPIIPLTLDPPQHGPIRRLINPAFVPRAVTVLEEKARKVTIQLIEGFADKGECEFIEDFAKILPITIFMSMVDVPEIDREKLMAWTEVMTRSPDIAARQQATAGMAGYIGQFLGQRMQNPGEDVLSKIGQGEVEGRRLSMEEMLSISMLLLFGGLDTVASMLGFIARFLAMHPGHVAQLRESPELIPQAIEELLRRHGIASTARLVKADVKLGGVELREDDMILIPTCLVGLDDRAVDEPMRVDFMRQPIKHAAFGNGPHNCPGAILARREIRVFLEEWLKRIPEFHIKKGTIPVIESGMVGGMVRLELAW